MMSNVCYKCGCRIRHIQCIRCIRWNGSNHGAMTVEAALVLPVLLCAFLSVIFIIRAVFAYELVNHALNETVSELASSGYIYHVSGIRDLHDTVRNGINDKAETFKGQLGSVFDTYCSLSGVGKNLGNGLKGIPDSAEMLKEAGQNFSEMIRESETAMSDPVEELKSMACYIASGALDDAKTQLFLPVLKLYIKKYFVTEEIPDADKRLKLLNIEGGFDGLDFSRSSFLADRNETIDLVVRYRINMPLPVPFLPSLGIEQHARAKVWMGGNESTGVLDGTRTVDDLWSLSNFQRGLKIRRIFGANLPSSFPVIARFSGGKAVMIKSVDMTAASYQKGDNARELLTGYIEDIAGFKGQEKPWGSRNILIRGDEIKSRELMLVIPENKLAEENEKLLAEMVTKARNKGVTIVIKRYGTKSDGSNKDAGGKTSEETDGETNGGAGSQ